MNAVRHVETNDLRKTPVAERTDEESFVDKKKKEEKDEDKGDSAKNGRSIMRMKKIL